MQFRLFLAELYSNYEANRMLGEPKLRPGGRYSAIGFVAPHEMLAFRQP
jgi:hypothetical protein